MQTANLRCEVFYDIICNIIQKKCMILSVRRVEGGEQSGEAGNPEGPVVWAI